MISVSKHNQVGGGSGIRDTILFLVMGVIYSGLSLYVNSIPNSTLSIVLVVLTILYVWGYKKTNFEKLTLRKIFVVIFIISTILFASSYQTGSDITNYILGARVEIIGKQNPYEIAYTEFKTDSIYGNFKDYVWGTMPYTYSPLFLQISKILLLLSGGNFLIHAWLFKLLFYLTYLSSVYLFSKINRDLKSIYLFALNPLILNELVRVPHVESLIIFILLLGIYYYKNKRFNFSFAAFIALVLIKIYYILLIPVYFLDFLRDYKTKFWKMFKLGFVGGITFVAFYVPYWRGLDTFTGIYTLFSSDFGLISYNTLTVILMPVVSIFEGNFIKNYEISGRILAVMGILLIIYYFIKSIKKKINFYSFINTLGITYLIFLFFMVNWFFPHYATVLIPLFALYSKTCVEKYPKYIFALTFYSALYYLILK